VVESKRCVWRVATRTALISNRLARRKTTRVPSYCCCFFPPVFPLGRRRETTGWAVRARTRHRRRENLWPQPVVRTGDVFHVSFSISAPRTTGSIRTDFRRPLRNAVSSDFVRRTSRGTVRACRLPNPVKHDKLP